MKKIVLYIITFVCICFIIPIIFTNRNINKEVSTSIDNLNEIEKKKEDEENKQEKNNENIDYDYKEYSIIKLFHSKTSDIEEIPIDEYIYGVVAAEMPANFEKEALKAQAVVARTYTIYKIQNNNGKHEGADICDDFSCCQAWISKEDRFNKWEESKREENWNKIVDAVDSTKGKIITYEGKPINAFFHSNSGGTTETTVNVWGGNNYPYLQSVTTSGEEDYTQYKSEVTLSKETFIDKLKEKYNDFTIDFSKDDCIKIIDYTDAGRIKNIKVGNKELSGVEIRTLLGLKSANFKVWIDEENIRFEVIGYGHGVGMSQTGADSMAKKGSNYEEIIKHFYTGVEITNL